MQNTDSKVSHWLLNGCQIYKQNWKVVLPAVVIVQLFNNIAPALINHLPFDKKLHLLLPLFFTCILLAGWMFFTVRLVRGDCVRVRDIFAGFRHYFRVLFTSLLIFAVTMGGFILFVIPGIVMFLKYYLGIIVVMDMPVTPRQALDVSGEITRGYKTRLLLLSIVGFVFSIASWPFSYFMRDLPTDRGAIYIAGISILYALVLLVVFPIMQIAWATAYNNLKNRLQETGKLDSMMLQWNTKSPDMLLDK
jgi:uncharacterized membrane protein